MSLGDAILYALVGFAAFGIGRASLTARLQDLTEENKKLKELFYSSLKGLRNDSVLLPSLAKWADKIQESFDDVIAGVLYYKKRPAKKAALEVREARKLARENKKQFEIVRNQLVLYEKLAPWLADYVDLTIDELLQSLNEDEAAKQLDSEQPKEDPVSKYVPKTEWGKLSVSERNQLALDRYQDPKRRRSLWRIGIEYERYVGYQYEQSGYAVDYHGATRGKQDLGIDLIARKDGETLIIQCKRLSRIKMLPVRENVVAQVFGATEFYRMESGEPVTPVLVTSYVLSEQAREFARHLKVVVKENLELGSYPLIKCNVSRKNGEKIYHLPMDQQYDKVIVGDVEGEFYASTIAEAESAGYRRAYKWSGN